MARNTSNGSGGEHPRITKAHLRDLLVNRDVKANHANSLLTEADLQNVSIEELAYSPGWGLTGAFVFQQSDEWRATGSSVGLPQFTRRLQRLATDDPDRTDLGDDRVVFDFSTIDNPLRIDRAQSGRKTHFRGEASDASTVFLTKRAGRWVVDEYCLRLTPPQAAPGDEEYDRIASDHSGDEIPGYVQDVAEAAGDTVVEVGALADDTLVWTRPPTAAETETYRFLVSGRTPHVAGYDTRIPGSRFLDWMAALLDEYDAHPNATGTIRKKKRKKNRMMSGLRNPLK